VRGRQAFALGKPLLVLLAHMVAPLPRGLVRGLYAIASHLTGPVGAALRWSIARRLAAAVGDNVFIGPRIEVRGWESLRLGRNVSIHNACFIDARGGLTIGDDVSIAHQCSLVTFEHCWTDESLPIRDNPVQYRPIAIANDVWIGCGARILAGASIGTRCIVAAGAVVTRAIPEFSIAGGIPAVVIGSTRRT
jgi:acetyltransferase-like isoleucine patch superfamily enzyme